MTAAQVHLSILPFCTTGLTRSFMGYAVGDGVAMGHIDEQGRIGIGPLVPIDTRRGTIAELCWASVSPDDRLLYATVFGYSNITTFHIDGLEIKVAKDPACPVVEGDGTAQGALRRHHQRPERQLDHAGRRISVSDLRECLEDWWATLRNRMARLAKSPA